METPVPRLTVEEDVVGIPEKNSEGMTSIKLENLDTDTPIKQLENPKADIDLFQSMFESWSGNDASMRSAESDLQHKLEICENKNKDATARISDLETTVSNLESCIDSLHNDLNLVEKLSIENQEMKRKLEHEEFKFGMLKKEKNEICRNLQNQIKTLNEAHEKTVLALVSENEEKIKEMTKEIKAQLSAKDVEIENIKKEKQSEISITTIDFEDKIAKLQRQKAVVSMKQQQQSSNNQEIFRRKLQHLKQEYEEKMSGLKNQVSNLQAQLRQEINKENYATQNRMSSTIQSSTKRMKRF